MSEYIREVMGERFTSKDFRTWAGTLICACALLDMAPKPESQPPKENEKWLERSKKRLKSSATLQRFADRLTFLPKSLRASNEE